jgi:L-rhamnose isomerase
MSLRNLNRNLLDLQETFIVDWAQESHRISLLKVDIIDMSHMIAMHVSREIQGTVGDTLMIDDMVVKIAEEALGMNIFQTTAVMIDVVLRDIVETDLQSNVN